MKKPQQKYRQIKLNKIKWHKILLFSATVIGIGAFIGAFAYRKIDNINFEGSSTVKPLIDKLASKYLTTQSDVDINVQAGGSGTGLQRVINNHTNYGNYSDYTTKPATSDKFKKQWANEQLKTITLAWDGIGLVYKKPSGCNHPLIISPQNVNLIYTVFSGTLAKNKNKADYSFDKIIGLQNNSACNIASSAYARAGGSKRSGTTLAFLHNNANFDFNKFKKDNLVQVDALENGAYGSDISVIETGEANSAAWSTIVSDNRPGSMIYLSTGFIMQNWDQIKAAGFEVAGYQNQKQNVFINPENFASEITKNYLWFRPLNTVGAVLNLSQSAKDFIIWALDDKQKELIKNLKFVPLTFEQIETMKKNNDFWISDVKLGYYGAQIIKK